MHNPPSDDPALDNRLTFIRRQSALDSRAALFVLSPVSPAELNEFVRRSFESYFNSIGLFIRFYLACNMPSMNPPSNITPVIPNVYAESETDILKAFLVILTPQQDLEG